MPAAWARRCRWNVVRAAMVVRLAGFARGGSGASPVIADAYVALLNAGVDAGRARGGLGRCGGSRGTLPHIALVAIGEGRAVPRRRGADRAPRRSRRAGHRADLARPQGQPRP